MIKPAPRSELQFYYFSLNNRDTIYYSLVQQRSNLQWNCQDEMNFSLKNGNLIGSRVSIYLVAFFKSVRANTNNMKLNFFEIWQIIQRDSSLQSLLILPGNRDSCEIQHSMDVKMVSRDRSRLSKDVKFITSDFSINRARIGNNTVGTCLFRISF